MTMKKNTLLVMSSAAMMLLTTMTAIAETPFNAQPSVVVATPKLVEKTLTPTLTSAQAVQQPSVTTQVTTQQEITQPETQAVTTTTETNVTTNEQNEKQEPVDGLAAALVSAYQNNPELDTQRFALKATDEDYAVARSGWRPQISAEGAVSRIDSNRKVSGLQTSRSPQTASLSAQQPLYRGGRTIAEQNYAMNNIMRGRAVLKDTEQKVLLDAVTAYMNVYQAFEVLKLNEQNEKVLKENLQATKDRFDAGEVTLTDTAQAEARLSTAIADTTRARGEYASARATYVRVIRAEPTTITKPTISLTLPASLEEAKDTAGKESPKVVASDFARNAALNLVERQKGLIRPELKAEAVAESAKDNSTMSGSEDSFTSTLRLTIPLYQSGAEYARIRAAQQTAAQQRVDTLNEQNTAVENVIKAWNNLETANSQIESLGSAIHAAEVALDGVQQEATVGARTVLDVLNAEQELLSARVNLVRADRDKIVAQYTVLAAIGQLTVQQLGLNTKLYDPDVHFQNTKNKWFGYSNAGQKTTLN
jgi:TolC family type I secretion outer membrane protein